MDQTTDKPRKPERSSKPQKPPSEQTLHKIKAVSLDNVNNPATVFSVPPPPSALRPKSPPPPIPQRRHSSTSHVIKKQMKMVIGSLEGILSELKSVVVDLNDVVVQIDDVTQQIEDSSGVKQKMSQVSSPSRLQTALDELQYHDIPNSIDSGLADISSTMSSSVNVKSPHYSQNNLHIQRGTVPSANVDCSPKIDTSAMYNKYKPVNIVNAKHKVVPSRLYSDDKALRRQSVDVMEGIGQTATGICKEGCNLNVIKYDTPQFQSINTVRSFNNYPNIIVQKGIVPHVNDNNNNRNAHNKSLFRNRNSQNNLSNYIDSSTVASSKSKNSKSDFYERQLEQQLENISESCSISDLYSQVNTIGQYDHLHSSIHKNHNPKQYKSVYNGKCNHTDRRKAYSDTLQTRKHYFENYNNCDSDELVSDDDGCGTYCAKKTSTADCVIKSSDSFRFKVKQIRMRTNLEEKWRVVIDP